MSKIIAVANVKGGVGKTTTTANLAAALAERGRKVVAVDLDPQSSLTLSVGFRPHRLPKTIRDALGASATPASSLLVATRAQFDLVPANHELQLIEHELDNGRVQLFAVRDALTPLRTKYDYILIDCPANAGILTANALAAADEILIPFPADYLALQALDWLLQIIRELQSRLTPPPHIAGLFLAAHDLRRRETRDIIARAQKEYGMKIPFFSASVRQSSTIKQAVQAGQTIIQYAPESSAAEGYRRLAEEVEKGIEPATTGDVYGWLHQGQAALANLDFAKAYEAFSHVTKLDPHCAEGWMGCAQSTAEWDESIRCYAQVLLERPSWGEAYDSLEKQLQARLHDSRVDDIPKLMSIGHYFAEVGLREYAELIFTRVTELDENHEEGWLGRARTTIHMDEATRCYEHALQLNSTNPQTRSEMEVVKQRLKAESFALVDEAQTLMHEGARDKAHAAFQEAMRMDPENDRAWLGCARTSENLSVALEFVKQALQINPQNNEARELYGWLYDAEGKAESKSRVDRKLVLGAGIAVSLCILAILILFFMY